MALLLLALVLGQIAGLAGELGSILSFSSSRSASMQALEGLEELAEDIGQSVDLSSPTPGDASLVDQVVLQKVDWASPDRMTPAGGTWAPDRAADLLTVTYSLVQGELVREVSDSGGTSTSTVVARDVSGFSASSPQAGSVELELSVTQEKKVETYHREAFRWVR